jgi:hypothetical protein
MDLSKFKNLSQLLPELKTIEIFRVTYDDFDSRDVHKLMKQTYNDGIQPFYEVVLPGNFTSVNTSSHDLQEIIKYYEHSYKLDLEGIERSKTYNNKKTYEIHVYCAEKTKEFLDKLKALTA